METRHGRACGEDASSSTRHKPQSTNGLDDVFGTIGQHVQNLNLSDQDERNGLDGTRADSDDFRWGNENVVDIIESLCMNCKENVGFLLATHAWKYVR